MYTVHAKRKRTSFPDIQDAVIFAREQAKNAPNLAAATVAIWDERNVVVAVVTDDANGLTVHRLATWPRDAACAY
jgi:hypothetical protein